MQFRARRALSGCLLLLLAACGDAGRGRASPVAERVESDVASRESVEELRRRIDDLAAEVERLRTQLVLVGQARTPVERELAPPIPAESSEHSPLWYLEQYVASFARGDKGSEYFRLAVEAYAHLLLKEIGALVLDAHANGNLRVALAAMLGDGRFRGNAAAMDPCLAVVTVRANEVLVRAALAALLGIGTPNTALALERLLWSIESLASRRKALEVLTALAGEGANAALVRLWASTRDDAERALLIAALAANEDASALELFDRASTAAQPVRLLAAERVGEFRFPPFPPFIDGWIARETDEDVRAALGAASRNQREAPSWSAAQAVGAPDAEAERDDPHAWASAQGDMGLQWLELGYDPPRRASGLAIHEVCVPGAVVAIEGIDARGERHALWSGSDPTAVPGVFEVSFATTSFALRGVRLVLDTELRPGWSEIDAVELFGPDGRAWASSARASSSFAGGGTNVSAFGFIRER